jgi:hypothetical protein
MIDGSLSATELAALIRAECARTLARPWPTDLELLIFSTPSGWKCGLTPAQNGDDVEYRDTALQIASQLQKAFRLRP